MKVNNIISLTILILTSGVSADIWSQQPNVIQGRKQLNHRKNYPTAHPKVYNNPWNQNYNDEKPLNTWSKPKVYNSEHNFSFGQYPQHNNDGWKIENSFNNNQWNKWNNWSQWNRRNQGGHHNKIQNRNKYKKQWN